MFSQLVRTCCPRTRKSIAEHCETVTTVRERNVNRRDGARLSGTGVVGAWSRVAASRRVSTSAEHGGFLALALSGLPQQSATDAAQSLAAAGEPHLGVRHAVVAPARTPAPSAAQHPRTKTRRHDYFTAVVNTRSSAVADGPRDASCQLKSCQLPRNSAETTCTTSPEEMEVMKLEGYSGAMYM